MQDKWFKLLVADRGDMAPELSDVQRFGAEREKGASLAASAYTLGEEEAIGAYEAHGRVTGGEREALLDQLSTGPGKPTLSKGGRAS